MRHHPLFWIALGLGGLVLAAAGRIALRDLPRFAPAGSATAATTSAPSAPAAPRLRGVFHVHSDTSHDARTPAAEQLVAAGRLGLDFVVFTEHNLHPVHSSPPGGPVAVPGTELSTPYGHLLYLAHEGVPPEDETRARIGLIDSLNTRGALTILSHPASPRRPWIGRRAGVGGLEIASTSSDARVKADPFAGILPGLLALPLRPELALAQLYRRDTAALRIWDRLEDPGVVGICGTDAHGWIDPELNFQTWQIVLDPWEGAPERPTAGEIVERLAAGRFVCVAALLAEGAPRFSFTAATVDGDSVFQGGSVSASDAAEFVVVTPELAANGARGDGFETVLLRDGAEVDRTRGPTLRHADPAPGTYRVEVRVSVPGVFFGAREAPALYSNRIRVTP